MSTPDLSAITRELAALRARLDEKDAAELAALRGEAHDGPVPRRHILRTLAGLGAASMTGMVATARRAAAAEGDPLVLGQANSSTLPTSLTYTNGSESTAEVQLGDAFVAVGGNSSNGTGVWGRIDDQGIAAVRGQVDQAFGVGVLAEAMQAGSIAIGAESVCGPTVWAKSDDGVTLRLEPASRTGPPTSVPVGLTSYLAGALSVDEAGEVWICVADGTPGTWTRLLREDTAPGRVVPITPIRALDTRAPGGRDAGAPAIPGQTQGPLAGGSTTTLDPAGTGSIPATATGIVGNVTAVTPNYNGYLTIQPAGTTVGTSTLNYPAGRLVANAFTTKLNPAGLSIQPAGTAANTLHVIIDITAYIT